MCMTCISDVHPMSGIKFLQKSLKVMNMTSLKQFMAVSVTGKYFISKIAIFFLGLPENQIGNKTGIGCIPKNNSYRLPAAVFNLID